MHEASSTGYMAVVAEKTREQWLAAVRRWLVVGVVVGLVVGTVAHLADDASSGLGGLLGSLAFWVPMVAATVLLLWAAMYRYDLAKVWGWAAAGLTFGIVFLLMAVGIGVGCLQGVCGG